VTGVLPGTFAAGVGTEDAHRLGGSLLLRMAGLPGRIFLAAGSADLFERVDRLEREALRYRSLAGAAAERIGDRVVTRPELSTGERRAALALRRKLHRAARIDEGGGERLAATIEGILGVEEPLRRELLDLVARSARLGELEATARLVCAAEELRLQRLPWDLALREPGLARLARHANPEAWEDLRRRVQRGEAWDGKRLRQRAGLLWKLIDRATLKATPRGWFAGVALVIAGPGGRGAYPPAVDGAAAVEWRENLYGWRRVRGRRALQRGDPAALLTVAPLHLRDGDRMRFWVDEPDPQRRGTVNEVALRRTAALEGIVALLGAGPATLAQVEDALIPAGDPGQRAGLVRFADHLAGLGVIEVSTVPRSTRTGWAAPELIDHTGAPDGPAQAKPAGGGDAGLGKRTEDRGYLDVYARAAAPVPGPTVERLEYLLGQALRVAALAEQDQQGQADAQTLEAAAVVAATGGVGPEPRPVLELLAEQLQRTERGGVPAPPGGPREPGGEHAEVAEVDHERYWRSWLPPADAGSGWARLLRWIDEHADGGPVLDLDPAQLDQVSCPPTVTLDWPCDALLRPLGPSDREDAVLGALTRAATVDARFVPALEALHGQVPSTTAYRRFLRRLEAEAGVTFVELIAPPLNLGAANAVRRPLLTRVWTGVPDLMGYCDAAPSGASYLPLNRITMRRLGDRTIAEADGRLLWPIHHATRTLQPPWRELGDLLLSAGAPMRARSLQHLVHHLGYSLPAFPGRRTMPRITVAGGLVLSAAQWRVPAAALWRDGDASLAKTRALRRLRRELGLPRFVFLTRRPVDPPHPCDLDSLRAVATIDRVRDGGGDDLLATEAIPAPDRLPIRSGGRPEDTFAGELVLRLPAGEPPEAMAARVAQALRRRGWLDLDADPASGTNPKERR
jgi:hypothetical protein